MSFTSEPFGYPAFFVYDARAVREQNSRMLRVGGYCTVAEPADEMYADFYTLKEARACLRDETGQSGYAIAIRFPDGRVSRYTPHALAELCSTLTGAAA